MRGLRTTHVALTVLLIASVIVAGPGPRAATAADVTPGPVPRATCGPGSDPEVGLQGRVTAEDVSSGRMADGARCNTELVGHHGTQAGLKVGRYVDGAGHECAFYDTEITFPLGASLAGNVPTGQFGTYVLDVTDPTKPVQTATLTTPAMLSPHESLLVNQRRGLLVAVMGNAATYPGFVDVYDLTGDCRQPKLLASAPSGILGHESGFAPDGLTFYVASLGGGVVTAVDLTDPTNPTPVWVAPYFSHGISISDDGTRLYMADNSAGLTILDVSQVQARVPNPQVPVVSKLDWPNRSTPQIAVPITIGGHPYVVEMDEFGSGAAGGPGAARIIDIADEVHPAVVSNIGLEVNVPANQAATSADPGGVNGVGGYAGHYCEVPRRNDPGIVACTFILSGLRIFDIHDPLHPREVAYYNAPQPPAKPLANGAYAMSNAAFVPERAEIWYSDAKSGFTMVHLTNAVWGAASSSTAASPTATAAPATATPAGGGAALPATGGPELAALGAGLLLLALVTLMARRRWRH
jgi:hypothetical protein